MMDDTASGSALTSSQPTSRPVTNHDIYAGYVELKKSGTGTQIEVLRMCRILFNLDDSLLPKSRMTSVYNKVVKVYKKVLEFNKNKALGKKQLFLDSNFYLPETETNLERSLSSCKTVKESQLKTELSVTKQENKLLKRKIEKVESENADLHYTVDQLVFTSVKKIQQLSKHSCTFIDRIKESKDNHCCFTMRIKITERKVWVQII